MRSARVPAHRDRPRALRALRATHALDHVAGALIHAEAGGFSARFDGSRYTAAHLDGGLLATTDPESWRALREALWEE